MPQLLSIQVGMPQDHGADRISKKDWFSGIFKTPVSGRVWLDTLNLDGDGQADLDNHGGPFRAVLTYAAAHYSYWRETLSRPDLAFGAFGENFTVTDLDEESVSIGDIFELGEARLQVTQPRSPCWKLARRNQVKDLAAQVDAKGWGGWYARVLQTGYVEAGQPLTRIEHPQPEFTIMRLNRLLRSLDDQPLLAALADYEPLSPGWRDYFRDHAA